MYKPPETIDDNPPAYTDALGLLSSAVNVDSILDPPPPYRRLESQQFSPATVAQFLLPSGQPATRPPHPPCAAPLPGQPDHLHQQQQVMLWTVHSGPRMYIHKQQGLV